MTFHTSHTMQDTSLLQYFQEFENINFDQKIRNKYHKSIIQELQLHPEGLTDRELQHNIGTEERNNISPRRNELVNGTKKHPELAGIIEYAGFNKTYQGKSMMVWVLNKNKLYAFMGI